MHSKEERIADLVNAKRTRREVLIMCDKDLAEITARQQRAAMKDGLQKNDPFSLNQQKADKQQMFWIQINRAEANFGLGDTDAYNKAVEDAEKMEHEDWMMASLTEQIEKLKKMKQKQDIIDKTS
jgi:hypothetical protein